MKPGYGDYVYEYENGCGYKKYYYDVLRRSIQSKIVGEQRTLDIESEENYRLSLLERHDAHKNPVLFYNHVMPMSTKSYEKLYYLADKNIFLYRKNLRRQLASYALAMGTKQYKPNKDNTVYSNVSVAKDVIYNLYKRIEHWQMLDKKDSEVVAYEDIDFDKVDIVKMPKKQNQLDPFVQLDKQTQDVILELEAKAS